MKRIVLFILTLLLLMAPAFAAQRSVTNNSDGSYTVHNPSIFSDNDSSLPVDELSSAFYEAIILAKSEEINEFSAVSDISIQPLWTGDTGSTPIPSSSLRSVLSSVIGPYSPVVVQYQYTNGSNIQYLREILPDYEWMFNCALFAMIIWCVFRLWGAILCNK